jgi:hypothetical protein
MVDGSQNITAPSEMIAQGEREPARRPTGFRRRSGRAPRCLAIVVTSDAAPRCRACGFPRGDVSYNRLFRRAEILVGRQIRQAVQAAELWRESRCR